LKVTDFTSDGGGAIYEIDRLINKLKVTVIIKYQKVNKKRIREFREDSALHLL